MIVDVTIPIGAAIVGALIMRAMESSWRRLEERRGPLRGEWWQHIPASGGKPAKLDHVVCRHHRDELLATIRRVEPTQPHKPPKQWTFRGYVRRGTVFGLFASADPHDLSYGTILLRVDGDDAATWDGFYNRVYANHEGTAWHEEIVQVPLHWSRSRS